MFEWLFRRGAKLKAVAVLTAKKEREAAQEKFAESISRFDANLQTLDKTRIAMDELVASMRKDK